MATFFLSVQKVSACSRGILTFKVPRDFGVLVKGRDGRPLEGISVKIIFAIPTHDLVAEELTNKEGKVFFHGLMVSDYWISAEHADVSGTVAKLWPVSDGCGSTVITLTWPEGPISKVKNLAGNLLVGRQGSPLADAQVWLTDTVSGKELGRISTDEKGRFEFQNLVPGLYALHIEEHRECSRYLCKIEGKILVEVDANAKDAQFLRYSLFMSSCGLCAYKNDGSMLLFE
ncbi:MAG: carboxypeptidase-like regulatory domain-containing protein [Terriglobales bacterium]